MTSRRMIRAKRAPKIDHTKIGKLLRLLASDRPGEVVAAAGALKRTLEAGGLDLHDLAAAAERGLCQPPVERQQRHLTSWAPPLPSSDDWQGMCWYLHFNRDQLRKEQREFVADMLLGQGDAFDCGRVCIWAITELRSLVAIVQAAR